MGATPRLRVGRRAYRSRSNTPKTGADLASLGLELTHNFSGDGLVADGVETGPEGTRGRSPLARLMSKLPVPGVPDGPPEAAAPA